METLIETISHFRDLYRGHEHWLFVYEDISADAIRRMRNRFYANSSPADFFTCALPPEPIPLYVAAARKRRMRGRDLRRHLSRYTPREFLPNSWEKDIFVMTEPQHLEIGALIISMVLEYGDLAKLEQIDATMEEAA